MSLKAFVARNKFKLLFGLLRKERKTNVRFVTEGFREIQGTGFAPKFKRRKEDIEFEPIDKEKPNVLYASGSQRNNFVLLIFGFLCLVSERYMTKKDQLRILIKQENELREELGLPKKVPNFLMKDLDEYYKEIKNDMAELRHLLCKRQQQNANLTA